MRTSHRMRQFAAITAAVSWGACQETSITAVDVAFVTVTPETETLRVGDVRQFQAQAQDASGNALRGRDVVWSVVDAALARVDDAGRVTALGPGSTRVLARVEGAIGEALIDIMPKAVASVEVTPATATIPHDGSVQLQVTLRAADGSVVAGPTVTFASSNAAVATVDASGVVRGVSGGTARITATAEGHTDEAEITVLPSPAASLSIEPSAVTIAVGATATLRIIARDAAGTPIEGHVAIWTSRSPDIARVEGGVVTGVSTGTAVIEAAVPGATAQAEVSVVAQKVARITVLPPSATLFVNGTLRLAAEVRAADGTILTQRSITWHSTAPALATVDATGLVTGVGPGNVQIIGTSEGVADTAAIFVVQQQVFEVRVEPASPTVVVKGSVDLKAILTAADGTVLSRPTTWSSADPSIATVNDIGRVTGVAAGSTTITATSEGKSGTATVTVSPQPVATVTVAPRTPSLFVGDSVRLVPTLRATDGTVLSGRPVTWRSSDAAVATVAADGLARAVGTGTATITATAEGVSGTATVTVTLRPDTDPPTVPTGLTATPVSSTQINLSWTAATDNVAVTGYRVFRNGVQVTTTASTSYSDAGLTASTLYSYTVAAFDGAGNVSSQSAAVQATTLASPDTQAPTVPTGLTATPVSSTQINLSWTAATDNVAVTGYRVFRNGVQVTTTATTSYSDAGLTASTAYSYTVAAFDGAGNVSSQSAAVQATTLASPDTQPPTVPTGLTATPVSSTQINLSWAPATDNVAVTGYRVFRNGVQVTTTATTSYSDAGLTASTAYSYTVAAFDGAGNVSSQSAAVQATTLASPDTQPPSVPTGLTATPVSSTQINLSWAPATDNVAVTGYRVYRNGVQVTTTATTSYSDAGLTASTLYSYTVAAVDGAGNASAQSSAVQATTLAAPDTQPPTVPTGLTATPVSSTQIDLSWAAATDNVAVTGYRVYRNGMQVATTASTSYSDAGRTASTEYSYTVAAVDGAGNASAQSAAVQATTLASPDTQPPSVPTGLTATAVSSTQINLSWTAATDNVAVTAYRVYRAGVAIATFNGTSYSDTGRNPSTTYSYTVTALDAAGNESAQSAPAQATTPDTQAPTVPTGLTATPVSSTQIDLSWTASTDDVGVTGYRVFRNGAEVATTASTNYQDMGLAASTTYSYTVAAFDAAGNASAQSAAVPATTPAPPDTEAPTVPTGLTATTVSSTQIDLSWAASTDNVGVTDYVLYRDGVQIATTANLSYSDTGLSPATPYSYTVAAVDAAGNASTQSAAVSATTDAAPDTQPPTVPTGLTATPFSQTQIDLSWTASTDDVGVTGYQVYRNGVNIASPAGTSYSDTGLTPSTEYTYTVAAFDAAGNGSAQSTAVSATTHALDTQAPTVPTGLTTAAFSHTQINLSWTASMDNVAVTGYHLYRDGVRIAQPTGTIYSDTGLKPETQYSYALAAVDAAGNVSAQSAPVPGRTLPPPGRQEPSVATVLAATALGSKQIDLSWNDSNAVPAFEGAGDTSLSRAVRPMPSRARPTQAAGL